MELVQHINQTQLCACVFVLILAPRAGQAEAQREREDSNKQDRAHLRLMIGPTVL